MPSPGNTEDSDQSETPKIRNGVDHTTNPPTPFIERIQPMSVNESLESNIWGADSVVPRDTDNGIEDPDWSYWGGDVIKGPDGTYHMFVARWPEKHGHEGWQSDSRIARCTATDPTGPFTFQEDIAGDTYGHNPAVVEKDGTYAVFNAKYDHSSAYDVAYAESLTGPWTTTNLDFEGRSRLDIPAAVVRDNGSIVVINRGPHEIHIGSSLTGFYRSHGAFEYPEHFDYVEDYTIWKENGLYHLIANQFDRKHGFYMYSEDALNWSLPEEFDAYVSGVTHYDDGTETLWFKMERPQVVVEDGEATTLYLAAIDVSKSSDLGNDNHSSKTVALPLASPTSAETSGPLSEGAYYIVNADSGHAMTVDGTDEGAHIIQRPYKRLENQRWLVTHLGDAIYRFESMHSGIHRIGNKVLAVERKNESENRHLIQQEWRGEDNQHWRLIEKTDGTYRFESIDSGGVADIRDTSNGTKNGVIESNQETADWHNWWVKPVRYGVFDS